MANTPVQNPSGWLSILSRLGITGVVRWFLSDTVIPVALVDSSITLNASSSTPLVNVPASGGEFIAPGAGTRLATTGPLPAGPYSMTFWLTASEAVTFRIRRRNAADAADVWAFRPVVSANFISVALRLNLAVNELVVVENVVAGSAGAVYQASIFVNAG